MESEEEIYYEPTITVGLQRPGSRLHQCALITERQSKRIEELMQQGIAHYDAMFQARKEYPSEQVSKEEYDRMMQSEFIQHEEEI